MLLFYSGSAASKDGYFKTAQYSKAELGMKRTCQVTCKIKIQKV